MNTRKPFIAGNWKMYKTRDQAVETAKALKRLVSSVEEVDIMIAPSFTSLFPVFNIIENTNIILAAQNISAEKEGAFTGEISAEMLISCGCQCVIIGHSERRELFKESDTDVNKKISTAVKHALTPILCVGESETQRDANDTFNLLDKQLEIGLEGFSAIDLEKLIIAYEPIWAIGTGKVATPEQAQEVHRFLRKKTEKKFGANFAEAIRIIYGGSVKPKNAVKLMAMPDIDGALVGGASLDAESFSGIIRYDKK